MIALLLFLGLVLGTVLLGFLAAVQGGGRAVAPTRARRRIVELSRPGVEQTPADALSSVEVATPF